MAEAWRKTYGRNPEPSAGYREAVRAVEAAVFPAIIPDNPTATLDKAIRAMKDAPVGRYETAFETNRPEFKPIETIWGLLELVWKSRLDRHGTPDENAPIHVIQQQAEAVLHAALPLVQWFLSGVVRRTAQ